MDESKKDRLARMGRIGIFAEVEELRAAAIKYGAFKVVGPTDIYDGTYGDGMPFGAVLFDGKKHYDGLEPPCRRLDEHLHPTICAHPINSLPRILLGRRDPGAPGL